MRRELFHRTCFLSLLPLLLISRAEGQTITETAIVGHGQSPVPRFSALYENKLIVPAERTVTLPPESDFDAIEVSAGGTLRVSRDYDTICKFIHLTVLPGGTLDMGKPDDPVLRQVDFIVKDRPLLCGTDNAPGPDPEQFGNGILIFGQWIAHGRELVKSWTTMQEASARATQLTLTEPVNWLVGDELRIPDTRQVGAWPWFGPDAGRPYQMPRRESKVKIAAINGNTITLTKPLDFEHLACRDPDGHVKFLPYVANATRNIVVRSENPHGVRGHTMLMERAHVDVRFTGFWGLGRTLPKKIDNTKLAGVQHIGTNQIARYAWHWHHVHGHADAQDLAGRLIGSFFDGTDIGKWACVQHGTHDLLFADNVTDRFVGGGFVTEDGFEIRGQFLRNLAMGCKGNPAADAKQFVVVPETFAPGSEGSGFWFHGSHHVVRDNVSVNNVIGFQILHMGQVTGHKVPKAPGGKNDTEFEPSQSRPIEFSGNVAAANSQAGFESWRQPPGWVAQRYGAWHNGYAAALAGTGESGVLDFRDVTWIQQGGVGYGVHSSIGYTRGVQVDGGEIQGFAVGLKDVISSLRLANCTLRNKKSLDFSEVYNLNQHTAIENVRFEKLTPESQFIVLGNGSLEIPRFGEQWRDNIGSRTWIRNWQGTGKNYFLFEPRQRRDLPVITSAPGYAIGLLACPETGLSNGQCWDKYGIGPSGGVMPDDSAPLDGLANGVAWEGDQFPQGPPRSVLISPTMLAPAELEQGRVKLQFFLTGDDMTSAPVYQVDNQPPAVAQHPQDLPKDWWQAWSSATATGPPHTVKTWRTNAHRQKIAGSELSFSYFVGTKSPPSPSPPRPLIDLHEDLK